MRFHRSIAGLLGAAAILFSAACSRRDSAPVTQRVASSAKTSASTQPSGAESQPSHVQRQVVVRGVDLTGIGYDLGDLNAPIVMVEFSDFGCPYCARHATQTFPGLHSEFIKSGKMFYKYVPLVMGFPNGDRAARAAHCAGAQNQFWEMHDSVYTYQKDWRRNPEPDVVLAELARKTIPDSDQWDACYKAGQQDDRIQVAGERAKRLGVRATPTFFVNGQLAEGALPLSAFRDALNAMLSSMTSQE